MGVPPRLGDVRGLEREPRRRGADRRLQSPPRLARHSNRSVARRLSGEGVVLAAVVRRIAITRGVSATINDCELTHVARTLIYVALAREQHAAYESLLASLGCVLLRIPA